MERTYNEYLDRLEAVTNRDANGTVVSGFAYTHNDVDQRTRVDREDGEKYAAYMYDPYGQLTNSEQNLVLASQTNTFGFSFDHIGNREETASNATTTAYYANLLNQYTNVQGTNLLYDLAGNVTNDGVRSFTWDAENRLKQVTPLAPAVDDKRLTYQHDSMGRCYGSIASRWNGSSWATSAIRYRVFDGWNLVCEQIVTTYPSLSYATNFYVWGPDLSGGLQGAGGVGGLISRSTVSASDNTTTYYLADGNGSIASVLDDSGTNVVASYEYGPFGNVIASSGTLASDNPFRFSTKYFDVDTGLGYWGYRWYDASKGRWLNRDPLGEEGGQNLYGYVGNNPISGIDPLGLMSQSQYQYVISESMKLYREFGNRTQLGRAAEAVLERTLERSGHIIIKGPVTSKGQHNADIVAYDPQKGRILFIDNKVQTTKKTVSSVSCLVDEGRASSIKDALEHLKRRNLGPRLEAKIRAALQDETSQLWIVANASPRKVRNLAAGISERLLKKGVLFGEIVNGHLLVRAESKVASEVAQGTAKRLAKSVAGIGLLTSAILNGPRVANAHNEDLLYEAQCKELGVEPVYAGRSLERELTIIAGEESASEASSWGGVALGGALAGPPGALIGGVVFGFFGDMAGGAAAQATYDSMDTVPLQVAPPPPGITVYDSWEEAPGPGSLFLHPDL